MPKYLYLLHPIIKSLKSLSRFLLVIFVFILAGCASSKSYYKKGFQLEEAGLADEAAKYYYMALQKNSNNVEAKIYLKKTAQLVLDNKMADFYKAHGMESYKTAVYSYLDAMEFKGKMERFISLDVAPYYEEYFEESKENYLEDRYEEANELLEAGRFDQSQEIFDEIAQLDPNYEDVKALKKISKAEPLYNEGLEALEAKKYREAYAKFDAVIQLKGAYKDALKYREEAKEAAVLTIALLPIESTNEKVDQEIIDRYYAKILSELLATKNEFIRVIDRVNTQKIIEEQKLGLSGLIDESKAAKTGELLGAKIVITGKLVDLKLNDSGVKRNIEKGYQAFRKRKYNAVGKYYFYETVYEKVTYDVYEGQSSVSSAFEFQMISSETGEVLLSEIFNLSKEDKVSYAVYEGDHKFLYPGTWKSKTTKSVEDQVFTSVAQKQSLDRKLTSRKRNLKSSVELKTEIIEEVGEQIAKKIAQYEKDRP